MSERNTLVSMGFDPSRVDWALREVSSSGDVQSAAVEHIFSHQHITVPPLTIPMPSELPPPLPTRSSWVPTIVHPTPSRIPTGSDVAAQESLIRNMSSLSVSESSSLTDGLEEPYRQSLERFREVLRKEQALMFGTLKGDHETGEKAYQQLERFFQAELNTRRELYGLPTMPLGPSSRSNSLIPPVSPSMPQFTLPYPQSRPVSLSRAPPSIASRPSLTSYNTANSFETSASSNATQAPSSPAPPRIEMPPSDSLDSLLSSITGQYTIDDEVKTALDRARSIQNEFSDKLWNLRRAFDVPQRLKAEQYRAEEDLRQREHSNKLRALYESNQYDAAHAADVQFQANEKLIQQKRHEQEFQDWKNQVADPGSASLMGSLQNLQTEYAIVEDVLDEMDDARLDVLHTAKALDELSNMMERDGVSNVEALEDEVTQRTHDLKIRSMYNDPLRTDGWVDTKSLDADKLKSEKELAVIRSQYKVKRTTPCFNLLLTRLRSDLDATEANETTLGTALLRVVESIPSILSPQEEEAAENVSQAAGELWAPTAIPSEALIRQIRQAHSILCELNSRSYELASTINSVSERQQGTIYDLRFQEAMQAEYLAGNGDNAWFSEKVKAVNAERGKTMDMVSSQLEQTRKKKEDRYKKYGEPAQRLLTQAKEREMAVVRLQAMGITPGRHSRTHSTGTMSSNEAMQKLLQQQQQTHMISNMMWGQHASNMAVINNIGSSSSQWTYSYQ